jgi:hypothetical protein
MSLDNIWWKNRGALFVDIGQHPRWLEWACWAGLIALFWCGRTWEGLPWAAWQSRMPYVSGGVGFVVQVFSHVCLRRQVPLAFGAVRFFGLELARAGEATDLDAMRRSNVMAWGYFVGLGLLNPSGGRAEKRAFPRAGKKVEVQHEVRCRNVGRW